MKAEMNDKGQLCIRALDLIEELPAEEQDYIIKALAWQDRIIEEVMDRLTGDSDWWASDDSRLRHKFLLKVEQEFSKDGIHRILDRFLDKYAAAFSNKSLYYELYHSEHYLGGAEVGQHFKALQAYLDKFNPHTGETTKQAVQELENEFRALLKELSASIEKQLEVTEEAE